MQLDDTRALELTYDLVATTMQDHDLAYLLSRFMHRVADVLGADAAVARLEQSGQLKLVDSHGLNAASQFIEPSVSSRLLRDRDNPDSEPVGVRTANFSEHMAGRVSEMTLLTLPLRFKGEMLGCYQFFIEGQESLGQNTQLLLENVSKHIGFLIEQHRLDQDAGRLLLVEERARMASEMHDSLAQTFASLRMQVRVLDETLHQGDEQVTWEEMEKLQRQVEQANIELRSLIGRFRAPLQSREVVGAVENIITVFRGETDTNVYFQNEWEEDSLDPDSRADVVRIVQESLANIRKHAQASNVRVLLRHHGNSYRLMVEDDGSGVHAQKDCSSSAGEHLGQSIMAQRAANLGGKLRIESESGEGTRVSLEFSHYTIIHK